jgi:hypothetical protein
MRALLTLTCAIALTLPMAAEAGMARGHGTPHSFRIHQQRHAPIARFKNGFRNRNGFRNANNANNFNNSGFFGPDWYDNGYWGPMAQEPLAAQFPVPPPMPRMVRAAGDGRATVEEENGVTVFRGPGSRHLAP